MTSVYSFGILNETMTLYGARCVNLSLSRFVVYHGLASMIMYSITINLSREKRKDKMVSCQLTCRSLLYNLLLDERSHAGGRSLQGWPDHLLLLALFILRVLQHKDK